MFLFRIAKGAHRKQNTSFWLIQLLFHSLAKAQNKWICSQWAQQKGNNYKNGGVIMHLATVRGGSCCRRQLKPITAEYFVSIRFRLCEV